jgi:hypothetical protein
MIVLKNINGTAKVDTKFRGRKIVIKPKCSHILDSDEEGLAEADFLKSTYGFLLDVTDLIKPKEVADENEKIIQQL